MKKYIFQICIALFVYLNPLICISQNQESFTVQGIVKENNSLLIDQEIFYLVRISNDTSDVYLWEEEGQIITNSFGIFTFNIGYGDPTSNSEYTIFSDLPWTSPSYMEVLYKLNEIDEYISLSWRRFSSVPFAMHARNGIGEEASLSNLYDVSTYDTLDLVLKFNGEDWESSTDAIFAYNSSNSLLSINSDSSIVALSLTDAVPSDSVLFLNTMDSSIYALSSDSSYFSTSSTFTDSADYSLEIISSLKLGGNDTGFIFGHNLNSDLIISSNSNSRLVIDNNGHVGINTNPNIESDLIINGRISFTGEHIDTSYVSFDDNKFLWDPKKSAISAGEEIISSFSDTLGRYAMSGGYQSLANSYSFSWGDSAIASGNNVVVIGINSIANDIGLDKNATGTAIGYGNIAGKRSISIGTNSRITGGSSSLALGNEILFNLGNGSVGIGNNLINDGVWSYLIGSYAKANQHSIIIADASSTTHLESTSNHQFLVRADGGVKIYSDTLMTTGVVLFSGSGSWSTLSDKNSKENILSTKQDIINKIKITNVYRWSYLNQKKPFNHYGPMAQDFYRIFNFGESERLISNVDMDGLIFCGTKKMIAKIERKTNMINSAIDDLNKIQELEQLISNQLQVLELEKKEVKND